MGGVVIANWGTGCGGVPILTGDQGRQLWEFVVSLVSIASSRPAGVYSETVS